MRESERRYRRRVLRPLFVLAALAAFAVVLTPTGSASPPSSGIKQATACLAQGALTSTAVPGICDTSNLPGGSTIPLTVTITNANASSQSLGSANLDAPASLPISSAAYVPGTGTGTQTLGTNTSSEIQLRNLNLPPNGSVSVTFNVKTPCVASGSLTWTVRGKQSNNFLGTGNDFSFTTTGFTTTIAAGGCKLVWVTQPQSAKPGDLITGAPFDPTGGTAGYVKVRVISGSCSSSCPTLPINGTVTLSEIAGSVSNNFTGNQAALVNGVAVFDGNQLDSHGNPVNNLMGTSAGTGFQLQAADTADGLTPSPNSDPFVIGNGEACTGAGCPMFNSPIDGNTNVDSSATGSGFNFLAINNAAIPGPVIDPTRDPGFGCAGFQSVGAGAFEETDGRPGNTNTGTLNFTYYISKALIAKKFGSNNGQPLIPICAGVKVLDSSGALVPCSDGTIGGWTSFAIDPNTGAFTGVTTQAVCYGNFWWGILGTSNQNPKVDPTHNPVITGWDSNTTYRFFNIQVPSPFDYKGGG